ncbi:peptide-methionine (S)-S-oxide reductase MsrA [Granulosicoccaceae sp. 1_MG-2023]|nr:peptide-methionine (S)-S-oxide reductase MsrA [Granulosicoccaceae sp. 1_MG-2023]
MKAFFAGLALAGLLLSASATQADEAVFAGGCFWCMESDFEKLDGVSEVISGFTGGELENPTYNGNHKGHLEAVRVIYDGDKLSYADLLSHFWVNIDPFDDGGQFCDRGHSYTTGIFVDGPEQRKLAEASKKLVQEGFGGKEVVTPILDLGTFYPITGDESYHQDYYKNNPVRYKYYRWSCGRDKRLISIWGDKATVDGH